MGPKLRLMHITIQFEPGQKVVFLYENRLCTGEISKVCITVVPNPVTGHNAAEIRCSIGDPSKDELYLTRSEAEIGLTKEELFAKL